MARYIQLKVGGTILSQIKIEEAKYKSPEDVRAEILDDKDIGDAWPCTRCRTKGLIYNPYSRPDPVEGNKNRELIKCPKCLGTGLGSKESCVFIYQEEVRKMNEQRDKISSSIALLEKAVKRLTKEEILHIVKMSNIFHKVGNESIHIFQTIDLEINE